MAEGKPVIGKDYLVDSDYYLRQWKYMLEEWEAETEDIEDEQEKKNPLSARNIGIFNTYLATRNSVESLRNAKLANAIRRAGGIGRRASTKNENLTDEEYKRAEDLANKNYDVALVEVHEGTLDTSVGGETWDYKDKPKSWLGKLGRAVGITGDSVEVNKAVKDLDLMEVAANIETNNTIDWENTSHDDIDWENMTVSQFGNLSKDVDYKGHSVEELKDEVLFRQAEGHYNNKALKRQGYAPKFNEEVSKHAFDILEKRGSKSGATQHVFDPDRQLWFERPNDDY
jgi:hypothetical protein